MYSLPTTTFDLHPSATRNRSNPPPAPSRFAPPKKRVFPRNNPPSLTGASVDLDSSNVVRNFYDGINRRDLAFVHDLISINCIYEDLIFSRPFVGREVSTLQFLNDKLSIMVVDDALCGICTFLVFILWCISIPMHGSVVNIIILFTIKLIVFLYHFLVWSCRVKS